MKFLERWVDTITHPPAFGLDISDRTAKFIQLAKNKNGGFDIAQFGEMEISEGIVVSGEIKKPAELGKLLRDFRDADGKRVRDRFVVASLPEEKSFVRVIQLPKVKLQEVDSVIKWELEGNIPLALSELYFDYEVLDPVANHLDHYDVLVTAFPKSLVDSYVAVLKHEGFVLVALELESQAISRAVIEDPGGKEAVIIVDIGATHTGFIIFGGGSMIFTVSIEVGGKDFDEAIMKGLGVSQEEARNLKKNIGLDRRFKNGVLFEAMVPTLSVIMDEIKKQLWFYRDHAEHRHGIDPEIRRIILSGGDANLVGLEKHLSLALKKEVVVARPFVKILNKEHATLPPLKKSDIIRYTTTVGLALRGAGY
ncbi:MAG: type IV pilus assembly protein PilM [bacterium]|nr:type IV pilus assembly protein PilM [bacterium]